jgi:type VI secretion system protein ImpL
MMKLFRKRLFVVAFGLLLVALLVWYAGPYLAFADRHPLGPVWARLALIALIVAV